MLTPPRAARRMFNGKQQIIKGLEKIVFPPLRLIFPKNPCFMLKKETGRESVAQRHDTCYTGFMDAGALARILKCFWFGRQEVRP